MLLPMHKIMYSCTKFILLLNKNYHTVTRDKCAIYTKICCNGDYLLPCHALTEAWTIGQGKISTCCNEAGGATLGCWHLFLNLHHPSKSATQVTPKDCIWIDVDNIIATASTFYSQNCSQTYSPKKLQPYLIIASPNWLPIATRHRNHKKSVCSEKRIA